MPKRNVSLTDELDGFLQTRVDSGRYQDAGEAVPAADAVAWNFSFFSFERFSARRSLEKFRRRSIANQGKVTLNNLQLVIRCRGRGQGCRRGDILFIFREIVQKSR
jgi:hypothetical protein